jgi:hypothetical protein
MLCQPSRRFVAMAAGANVVAPKVRGGDRCGDFFRFRQPEKDQFHQREERDAIDHADAFPQEAGEISELNER